MPFVRPVVKLAATAGATAEIPGLVDEACGRRAPPAHRPGVPRLPARLVFMEADGAGARRGRRAIRAPRRSTARALERAVALLRDAERPVIMAGNEPLLGRAARTRCASSPRRAGSRCSSTASRAAACPPTTSCSSRARAATALKGADVALVIGVPMDFRLGFGGAFGEETELIVLDVAEPEREHPRAGRGRALRRRRRGAARAGRAPAARDTTRAWVEHLRGDRDREARGRARSSRRRPRAAAPDARLRRARRRCSTATRS